MDKLLSIIIPAYNMEKYLDKSVGSCLVVSAADRESLDVIIVNDGSKDRTSEIAHGWETRYPNVVRVIDKPNGNYGSCINTTLPIAKGTFVKILDADDSLTADGLMEILDVLRTCDSDIDLVVNEFRKVDPNGNVIETSNYALPRGASFPLERCRACTERLTLHSIAYRRSLFDRFAYHQTEDISYTDTEWIIEPMVYVRKVRATGVVAYEYLVGRDCQTMDKTVFKRNFHMVERITVGLVAKWADMRRARVDDSLGYVHDQLLYMLSVVYKQYVYASGGGRLFRAFDRRLAEMSRPLYDEAEGICIPSNHFPFYPVRAFRRWRTRQCPPFWAHWLYHWVAVKVGKIRKLT